MGNRSYTLEEKYEAAAAVVVSGTAEGASRQTGFPASTIRAWSQDEDFKILCQEVRAKYGDEIKGNLARIVKEGTVEIMDRIKDGDHVFDKKGNVIRKKMSGRDLTIATGTMFDKLRVIEGQPTHIVHQSDGLSRIRRFAYLRVLGLAGEKDAQPFRDEDEWWLQLPDSEKKAFQKVADRVAAMVPDGAAVDTLKYLKLEAAVVHEPELSSS